MRISHNNNLRREIWDKLELQIYDQIQNQIYGPVFDQVLNQVFSQLANQVEQNWSPIWSRVQHKARGQFINQK
jgi:hypothetical protein